MKRRLCMMGIFLLALAASAVPAAETGLQMTRSDASGVGVSLAVSDFTLSVHQLNNKTIYRRLSLPGGGLTAAYGKPELPVRSFYLAVPQEAEVSLSYSASGEEIMTMDHAIFPAQLPMPETQGFVDPPFVKDQKFYAANEYFPASVVEVSPVMVMRGCRIVMVSVFPFAYNPGTQSLKIYRQVDISIDFVGGTGEFVPDQYRSVHFQPFFDAFLMNSQMLERAELTSPGRGGAKDTGADLLVVVYDSFYDEILPLAAWRNQTGIKTMVVNWSDIGTTAADLRSYMSTAYSTWDIPPSFLLIVGDADHVPVNYINTHPYHGSLTGTDLWYVAVDGTDYFPDIHQGRISVENESELTTVVNKILGYCKTPYTGVNWYDDILLAAYEEYGRYFVWGSETIYTYLNAHGYTCNRQYQGGTPSGSTAGCISAINSGVLIANHRDHGDSQNDGGSYTGWSYPNFTTTNIINDLSNGPMYPLMFSINCNSGWFDGETDNNSGNYESIGEVGLRAADKGCIAVVCSTRVSYSGYNDEMCRGFYDGMFPLFDPTYPTGGSTNPYTTAVYKVSQIMNFGKFWMYDKYLLPGGCDPYPWTPTDDISRTTFEMFHVHGDPTLEIWTALPTAMVVTHASACIIGQPTFTVNVDQEGALAALTFDGEIVGLGTASGGMAVVTIDPPLTVPGTMTVTVTAHNRIPYEADVTVIPPDGPYVMYTGHTEDDSSGNGDGNANPNETIDLSITVKNYGSETAYGVTGTLSSTDTYVTITDDTAAFGDVAPDASALSVDLLTFEIANDCPDGHTILFTLTLTDGVDIWESGFSIGVIAAELTYYGYTITDDPMGNNDGDVDMGETVYMEVDLTNSGGVDVMNVSATITTDDPAYVTLLENTALFPDIAIGNTETSLSPHFRFEVDLATPCGESLGFNITVTTSQGISSDSFEILVGGSGVGFADDMESGVGAWTHSGTQDTWDLETFGQSHSPTHSWHADAVAYVSDQRLETPEFNVSPISEMTFWHTYDVETGWDGCVIEITTNGGSSWSDLGPYITQGGYNDTVNAGYSNPLEGRQAWSGGTIGTMTQVAVNLGTFAGNTAKVRFRLGTDDYATSYTGWYVDDVEILGAECQPYTQPLFSCNAEALTPVVNPGGQARFRLTVENITDQSLTRKVVTNIYLCNGNFLKEDLSFGFVPFDPYQIRQATRVLNIPGGVPQGLKNCDLRYELVVIDRDTGAVLCSSSCYFQIQD